MTIVVWIPIKWIAFFEFSSNCLYFTCFQTRLGLVLFRAEWTKYRKMTAVNDTALNISLSGGMGEGDYSYSATKFDIGVIVLRVIITLFGLPANAMVIFVVCKFSEMKTYSNIFCARYACNHKHGRTLPFSDSKPSHWTATFTTPFFTPLAKLFLKCL